MPIRKSYVKKHPPYEPLGEHAGEREEIGFLFMNKPEFDKLPDIEETTKCPVCDKEHKVIFETVRGVKVGFVICSAEGREREMVSVGGKKIR